MVTQNAMMSGVELIAEERTRQVEQEGWSAAHDQQHSKHELIYAAEAYLLVAAFGPTQAGIDSGKIPHPSFWPWLASEWKPRAGGIGNLIKAGALIAAEIDRLQQAELSTPPGKG